MDPGLLTALLAFVAIGGIGFAFVGGNQPATASKRVKSVASARTVDRRKQAVEQAALKRKQTTQEALKELTLTEKQSRKRRLSVKGQLAQAGVTMSPTVFWILAAVLGLVLGFIGLLIKGWIAFLAAFFVGLFGIPRWLLGTMVAGRQKKFGSQLADAIDVIVRGVKSGLPLNQCLRIIAGESPEPLRTEFQMLVDAQAMGVPLDVSLQRLYDRMPLPEVNFF